MKYFQKLKTSEKISFSFSLFGFLSLVLFLVLINITYFFIWYADQQEKSFSDMNESYIAFQNSNASEKSINDFKDYLLMQDTMIIPENGELICSPWVSAKIKEDPESIQNRYFYKDGETIYFIYSQNFPNIGEVKVFFDTTPYITSQLIIIKISIIFIFITSFLQFFVGKAISKRLLRDLKRISEKVKNHDIHKERNLIICDANMPEDDEIFILVNALNNSYLTIKKQTQQLKQFITDVSHEFKTPLMGMSSELDLLEKKQQKKGLEDTDIETLFWNSRKNIHKLNGLLETLFFLSRIEEKSWCLVKKEFKIEAYMRKKVQEISASFPHKNIVCNYDIDKNLKYKIEENTFSIFLDNLLSNAIKFSPEDVELHIQAKEDFFSLEDNGPWISKKEQEKIWNKFYRKDTNIEWFGIGLYLVKRIAWVYDWNIELTNGAWWWARFKIVM